MTKVSIIIPCYNQAKYVKEAILSAINQTYQNIEIVCINDGSTDNTSEVVQKLADKYKNILFIDEQENKGVVFARNLAIKTSTGDYILPLDADDIIEPTYIEKAVKILDENKHIGIVYCQATMFGTKRGIWKLPKYSKTNMLYENSIFCTALFRKSDFIKVGGYKSNMQCGCEDYDLWLSFIELGLDVYQINENLFRYRKYNETSRTDLCSENIDEVYKQLIRNHINLYLEDKEFVQKLSTDIVKIKKNKEK